MKNKHKYNKESIFRHLSLFIILLLSTAVLLISISDKIGKRKVNAANLPALMEGTGK